MKFSPIKHVLKKSAHFATTFLLFTLTTSFLHGEGRPETGGLPFEISYAFEEGPTSVTIEDILAAKLSFQRSPETELNFGFDPRPLWVKIILVNDTDEEQSLFLDIDFPPMDYIDFYGTERDRIAEYHKSGDHYPIALRPILDRNHIFPFLVNPGSTKTLYLRFRTTSVLAILPAIYTSEQFRVRSNQQNLIFGIFYGMALIMVIYSLGQFLILRDRIFILYSFYIFSLGFFLFVYNGFAFLYLFPDSTYLTNRLNPAAFGASIFFALLFSIEYLGLRTTQKSMAVLQMVLAGIAATCILLAFITPYRFVSISLNVLLLLVLAGIFLATFRGIALGNTMAWFYLLSFSGFLISGAFVVMSNLALLGKSVSTIYSIQAAAALEMVILALGVSYRYRRIREEKDRLTIANELSTRQLSEINSELETARQIQSALLPERPPAIPGVRIVVEYEPSGKLGGDYFDFFEEDDEAGILIADVTGHGTPAALFASLVRYTFQTYRPFMRDPSGLLEWMNRTIYGRLGDHFLTAGYLYLNPGIQTIRYGSCGHPALLHQKSDGSLTRIKGRGRAMGLIEQNRPETVTVKIEQDDRFLLYTDGLEEVFESNPAAGAGSHPVKPQARSLEDFLRISRSMTTEELVTALRESIRANRAGPAPVEDDITWILIEFL